MPHESLSFIYLLEILQVDFFWFHTKYWHVSPASEHKSWHVLEFDKGNPGDATNSDAANVEDDKRTNIVGDIVMVTRWSCINWRAGIAHFILSIHLWPSDLRPRWELESGKSGVNELSNMFCLQLATCIGCVWINFVLWEGFVKIVWIFTLWYETIDLLKFVQGVKIDIDYIYIM